MDDARLSRFPHLSWITMTLSAGSRGRDFVFRTHLVNHWLSCSLHNSAHVQVIRHGEERQFVAREETVWYAPADASRQVVIRRGEPHHAFAILLIPDGHLRHLAAEHGREAPTDAAEWIRSDQHEIAACVRSLIGASSNPDGDALDGQDEVARRLILRLVELNGGGRPDWHDDASVFDRRTLRHLVDTIDAHLKTPPAGHDLAPRVGLSPGHFAKKFRQSTGLTLGRFIHRRRMLRALDILKTEAPLAGIALELGFSSQSHFTRIFSELTGMTPAHVRKQVR